MDIVVIVPVVAFIVCGVFCLYEGSFGRKKGTDRGLIVALGLLFLILAVVVSVQNHQDIQHRHKAVISIEQRYGMTKVELQFNAGIVSYQKDGKACQAKLLQANGDYLVAINDATCADLPK